MAERNLTRAARNLSMTQPAVSNALSRLRDALGDKLVARSGYGVEPTPRALALWPAVRDALRQLEASLAPGDFVASEADNTFVLAMADATAAELMPGLVEIIERDAPGVSMRVLPLTTRDPRRLLDEGQMDLAVGFFPAVLADLTAQAQAGRHGRLRPPAAVRRRICLRDARGPSAGRGPLTLDRFCDAHHLLVSFSGRPFGFIDEALASLGRKRRIVLTVNQFFTAGRVVAARTCSPCCRGTSWGSPAWRTSWCCATCRSRCRRCTSIRCGTGARASAATTPGCGWRWRPRPQQAPSAGRVAPRPRQPAQCGR